VFDLSCAFPSTLPPAQDGKRTLCKAQVTLEWEGEKKLLKTFEEPQRILDCSNWKLSISDKYEQCAHTCMQDITIGGTGIK